jgi:hypothetical protein
MSKLLDLLGKRRRRQAGDEPRDRSLPRLHLFLASATVPLSRDRPRIDATLKMVRQNFRLLCVISHADVALGALVTEAAVPAVIH